MKVTFTGNNRHVYEKIYNHVLASISGENPEPIERCLQGYENITDVSEQTWRRFNGAGDMFIQQLRDNGVLPNHKAWKLSNRAISVIQNMELFRSHRNLTNEEDCKALLREYIEGHPYERIIKHRNCGSKTTREILKWLGMDSIDIIPLKREWKFNPYTGEPIQ